MSGFSDTSGAASPVEETANGVVLRVRVRPRSSRRGVLGVTAGAIAIGVGAAPEKGRATEEAVRTLARWLGVAPSRLSVLSGATTRSKRVAVAGATVADVRSLLDALWPPDPS